mmetsp:Transcript_2131/g.5009  ORF Transcript_2131/g.5009 Transcript_2131/m.5009 type:complete len:363 (-) Transcript_2131:168-1256(-)
MCRVKNAAAITFYLVHSLAAVHGFLAPSKPTFTRILSPSTKLHMNPRAVRSATISMAESLPLSLFSPAKTNLFLRITRKRDDGFHELASVFQALGLGDTLSFETLEQSAIKDVLTCNVADVPLDGRNLIIKAFELFRERAGVKTFFKCHIDKQTPMEGGMGGGSSNCATALWAANKLSGSPVTDQTLIEWGGELGSDVSFFLSDGTAYCTGRGEIVESISPPLKTPKGSFWILKPTEGCSTPAVYKALGLSPGQELPGPDPVALRDQLIAGGLSADVCINDLEPPAQQVLPKLVGIKEALQSNGFHTVLLSGSGATTFCLSEDVNADPKAALESAGMWEESMWVAGPLSFVSREGDAWYNTP